MINKHYASTSLHMYSTKCPSFLLNKLIFGKNSTLWPKSSESESFGITELEQGAGWMLFLLLNHQQFTVEF